MNIANNIIKDYLKNVYFILGTAYAGKSTICKMLAEKYDMIHCKENYAPGEQFYIVNQTHQPNLNYFNTKKSWDEYLNRGPDEYTNWISGNNEECAGFEAAKLLKISENKKVIVDTNIPIDTLKEIAGYNQIAIMLSPIGVSENYFFERNDEEKIFLKNQILNSKNPEATMANFKNAMKANTLKQYNEFINSGCYIIKRKSAKGDERQEIMEKLTKHFCL